MVGWYVCLVRWGDGVVEFLRGVGSSCGMWFMNADWIVMVCSCSGGGVCVILVIIVVGWLGSGGVCICSGFIGDEMS